MADPVDWYAKFRGMKRGPERKRLYNEKYLRSPHWAAVSKAARERAGNACQVCNRTKRLNVHHRIYERLGREEPMDLFVLCDTCHRLFHEHGRLISPTKSKKRKKKKNKASKPLPRRSRALLSQIEATIPSGIYTTAQIVMLLRGDKNIVEPCLIAIAKREVVTVKRSGKRRWQIITSVSEYEPNPQPSKRKATPQDLAALAKQLQAASITRREAFMKLPAEQRKAINNRVARSDDSSSEAELEAELDRALSQALDNAA